MYVLIFGNKIDFVRLDQLVFSDRFPQQVYTFRQISTKNEVRTFFNIVLHQHSF